MHSGARSVSLAWSVSEATRGQEDLPSLDEMQFLLNPVPRVGEEILLIVDKEKPENVLHMRVVEVLHHVTPVQDKLLIDQPEPLHHVDVFVEIA